MQVDFYHLVVSPLERVLPQIAEKVLAGGGRLLVVCGDANRRGELDRLLWTYSAESFLPHGQVGEGEDAGQPVLFAGEATAGNGARIVAMVDGVWRDDALSFDRALHFFDAESLVEARVAWRTLASREGVERRYWKQDERGRFERAA